MVQENEIELLGEFGAKLAILAIKHKLLCLAANQVGDDRNAFVLFDGGPCDGYSFYVNLSITHDEAANKSEIPTNCISFPKKRLLLSCADKIVATYYDTQKEASETKELKGDESLPWQFANTILMGVDPQKVVDTDFYTIRNTNKKPGPNDRCPKCGRKNKRCLCADS